MDVVGAYVSFTEVEPGAHDAYNRWHLFDHLPEQYRLPGIALGQRWVLPPARRATATLSPPLDRIHYVTLYLLTEPLDENVAEFRALGQELYDVGRFDTHRRSHLDGPLRVRERRAAPGNPLDPRAVPFAPHRGVRVVLDGAEPAPRPGAVGTWTFDGVERVEGRRLAVEWWVDAVASEPDATASFDAVLDIIDPFGPYDWFG